VQRATRVGSWRAPGELHVPQRACSAAAAPLCRPAAARPPARRRQPHPSRRWEHEGRGLSVPAAPSSGWRRDGARAHERADRAQTLP